MLPAFGIGQNSKETQLPAAEKDLGMWWSASIETKPFRSSRIVEKDFFRKFRVAFEFGHRRNENMQFLDQNYIDLSAKYRVKKWFRVASTYRYSMRDKYSMNRSRFVVDANLRKDMKRYTLKYRLRYQHNFGPLPPIPDLRSIRNKVQLAYNIRKFKVDPWLGAEVLSAFNYKDREVSAVRYELGMDYSINKVHEFELTLRHQRQIGVRTPVYENIISISYAFTLK